MYEIIESKVQVPVKEKERITEGFATEICECSKVIKTFKNLEEAKKYLAGMPKTDINKELGYGNLKFYSITEFAIREQESLDCFAFSKIIKSPIYLKEIGLEALENNELIFQSVLFQQIDKFEKFLKENLNENCIKSFDIEVYLQELSEKVSSNFLGEENDEIIEGDFDYEISEFFSSSKRPETISFKVKMFPSEYLNGEPVSYDTVIIF